MNDYKELIAKCDYWIELGREIGRDFEITKFMEACRDAIEQLVKERDDEPARHWHWERIKYTFVDCMRCSACGDIIWTDAEFAELGYLKRFCPKCGSKMDEDENT